MYFKQWYNKNQQFMIIQERDQIQRSEQKYWGKLAIPELVKLGIDIGAAHETYLIKGPNNQRLAVQTSFQNKDKNSHTIIFFHGTIGTRESPQADPITLIEMDMNEV